VHPPETRAEFMRTNHPSLLLSPDKNCQRSTELSSASGDLLRVVDQDPGFWLGERSETARGIVGCCDECPVSGMLGKNGMRKGGIINEIVNEIR